jgi:hypothetical protein
MLGTGGGSGPGSGRWQGLAGSMGAGSSSPGGVTGGTRSAPVSPARADGGWGQGAAAAAASRLFPSGDAAGSPNKVGGAPCAHVCVCGGGGGRVVGPSKGAWMEGFVGAHTLLAQATCQQPITASLQPSNRAPYSPLSHTLPPSLHCTVTSLCSLLSSILSLP